MDCPKALADALLDVIRIGILRIRAAADDPARCVIEADHIRKLPQLLKHYRPELLEDYWAVERPNFIRQSAGQNLHEFEPHWDVLRPCVETLPQPW